MQCKLCGSNHIKIEYNGYIRNGGLGKYTKDEKTIFHCEDCDVIWHDTYVDDLDEYYESTEYRMVLEGTEDVSDFYRLHDGENWDKFQYTGTEIFRDKIVADIGCGGGAFCDFISGSAQKVVAIEPAQHYRKIMDEKGYDTYPYMDNAKNDYRGKIDVITSFDVIEHVKDPLLFMKDIYELLSNSGVAMIGTPTDAPIMRRLLKKDYEKKLLFSVQHLWIFSEKNLKMLAQKAGLQVSKIKYFQRYGIGNLLGWLREKQPNSDIKEDFITETLDAVWKSECSKIKMADYIVIYVSK